MAQSRQILLSLLVVIVAAAGWYFLSPRGETPGAATATVGERAGGRPGGRGPATVTVVTEPVIVEAVTEELQAVGTAVAAQAVTLFPQVSGVVTEVAVRAGDRVAKDAVLFRFDSEAQAIAVERARIAAEDAKAAVGRAEQLAQSRNISAVALAEARSRAASAEIDLRTAELELERRTVKAPFAGVVGLPGPTVGDLVSTATPLVTLDDVSSFTVSFQAPERFSPLMKMGHPVTATSAGLPGVVIGGAVSAVDSRVDEVTRTFRIEARLEKGIESLKPGMSVVVRLSFPQEPRPAVPSMAIQWDRAGAFVWKVTDSRVQRTPVQILSRRAGLVYVDGALAENDVVVVEGLQRLRDGSAVAQSSESQRPPPAAGPTANGAGG